MGTTDDRHDDPRLAEVDDDTGMPGEVIDDATNQPGSQEPPEGVEPSATPISDAGGR